MQISAFNSELYSQVTQSFHGQVTKSDDGSRISVNLKQTSIVAFSQQRSAIGHSALANSLHHSLKIGDKPAEVSAADDKAQPFDFKKVADNVMKFVGQSVMEAKRDGASDEELGTMLNQARSGIEQGFADAKDELEQLGMLDERMLKGIDKAYDNLTQRIDKLEDRLFGREPEVAAVTSKLAVSDMSRAESQTGDLTITTKDGDVVTLNFENIEAYSKRISIAAKQDETANQGNSTLLESNQNQQASVSAFDQLAANIDENGNVTSFNYADGYEKSFSGEEQYAFSNSDENGTTAIVGKMSYQHYESQNFAFSVEGELDEDELAAIGSLVNDLAGISDEFFNGDPMAAFEQGLSLGYNTDELASFSMNLQQVQTTQVTNVYQEVAQYAERPAERTPLPESVAKPLSDYGQQMQQVAHQAEEKLSGRDAVKELITEMMQKQMDLLSEQLKDSEDNFKAFNQDLLAKLF